MKLTEQEHIQYREDHGRNAFATGVIEAVSRVVAGQRELLEGIIIGLLCDGHVLVEGVPGLAKTLSVRTLAEALEARFARIQFTPDLLPADVVGTQILVPGSASFQVKRGPVFTNVLLADEINRAPAKVQSALLEAMQERQVTIGDASLELPDPFVVLATQNPIEQEGTHALPEAQLDRFLLKVTVDYPAREDERRMLERVSPGRTRRGAAAPVATLEQLKEARGHVAGTFADARISEYVLDLVAATRRPSRAGLGELEKYLTIGASPRASLSLLAAAKAHAFLRGRQFVIPDDVKRMALPVLRHRLGLTYEAEVDGVSADALVRRILDAVEVP